MVKAAGIEQAFSFLASGGAAVGLLKLDELVSGIYPIEEINAAIDSVKRGRARRNVVVFGEVPGG